MTNNENTLPGKRSLWMNVQIIWTYHVLPEYRDEFRTVYGPAGDWAKLFARHPGYICTRLLYDVAQDIFLTIDLWKSEVDEREFFRLNELDYEAMNERFASFVANTVHLGSFVDTSQIDDSARGASAPTI